VISLSGNFGLGPKFPLSEKAVKKWSRPMDNHWQKRA